MDWILNQKAKLGRSERNQSRNKRIACKLHWIFKDWLNLLLLFSALLIWLSLIWFMSFYCPAGLVKLDYLKQRLLWLWSISLEVWNLPSLRSIWDHKFNWSQFMIFNSIYEILLCFILKGLMDPKQIFSWNVLQRDFNAPWNLHGNQKVITLLVPHSSGASRQNVDITQERLGEAEPYVSPSRNPTVTSRMRTLKTLRNTLPRVTYHPRT